MRFGVLLNMGASLGSTAEEVFDLTLEQADRAEELGYDELWVTEHHFIRFGINPSALTAAGFLLGRTERIRVGTAVELSPLTHPVEFAERTALLDQLSGGRFELGLGRGGYARDYELLDKDPARWDDDPQTTAQRLIDIWTAPTDQDAAIQPPPRTRPHPPLLLATGSEDGVRFAARHDLPLQHYFAVPAAGRVAVEARYDEARREHHRTGAPPDHLHTLIVIVTEERDARDRLEAALRQSFRDGDHPQVPQNRRSHAGSDGKPIGPDEQAAMTAAGAIVGPVGQVVDELGAFIDQTSARRVAVYAEAIADRDLAVRSLTEFAERVAPQLPREDGLGGSVGRSAER